MELVSQLVSFGDIQTHTPHPDLDNVKKKVKTIAIITIWRREPDFSL
jgi:hypothetical protein